MSEANNQNAENAGTPAHADNTGNNTATMENGSTSRRRFLLIVLASIVLLGIVGYGLYYFIHGRWYESTDDAYVNGNIVQVTPQTAGTIVEIGTEDNTQVRAGQALIKLDPNDSRVALEQSEAALARSVRQVRGLYSNVEGQSADFAAKRVALERAREDLDRRRGLDVSGAIAKEEFAHVQSAYDAADRGLAVSREQLTTTRALIDDTTISTHPEIKAAASAVRKAYLDYARTTLVAPVTGYVTQRNAQVGQRVSPGLPLMSLVPLDQLWIDANFKETQLKHMRIGQPVDVTSDLYGSDVTYHGHIASFGIGTGSSMSLLPAQNATGNWIKIVQRIPVRIALDPAELHQHPLRIGLSTRIEVSMHDRSGPVLTASSTDKPVYTTDIYQHQLIEAEARIGRIIHANAGAPVSEKPAGNPGNKAP